MQFNERQRRDNMAFINEVKKMSNSMLDKYYKLILLIGKNGSGKTSLINELCAANTYSYINLNLALSEKLKDVPIGDRCYCVQDFIDEIIRNASGDFIVLDNIELIFSKHLQLEPLGVLKNIAKYRKTIVAWQGSITNGYLTYAEPTHEDYVKYKMDELECLYINLERGL